MLPLSEAAAKTVPGIAASSMITARNNAQLLLNAVIFIFLLLVFSPDGHTCPSYAMAIILSIHISGKRRIFQRFPGVFPVIPADCTNTFSICAFPANKGAVKQGLNRCFSRIFPSTLGYFNNKVYHMWTVPYSWNIVFLALRRIFRIFLMLYAHIYSQLSC